MYGKKRRSTDPLLSYYENTRPHGSHAGKKSREERQAQIKAINERLERPETWKEAREQLKRELEQYNRANAPRRNPGWTQRTRWQDTPDGQAFQRSLGNLISRQERARPPHSNANARLLMA